MVSEKNKNTNAKRKRKQCSLKFGNIFEEKK